MFFEKEIVAKTDRFISDRYLRNIQKAHMVFMKLLSSTAVIFCWKKHWNMI